MTNVIPLDPKKRILASLRPASLSEAQAAVAVLAKALPIMPSIQDPPAFKGIMAEFLAPYPADVLMEAVNQAIEDLKHMPSIHEMVELCKRLVVPRTPNCAGWSKPRTRSNRSNAKPTNAPSRPNEKPNARRKTRLVDKPRADGCNVLKRGPASAWVMLRHCRAMSRSPMAFRSHWSAAGEAASRGRPHWSAVSHGPPNSVGKWPSPSEQGERSSKGEFPGPSAWRSASSSVATRRPRDPRLKRGSRATRGGDMRDHRPKAFGRRSGRSTRRVASTSRVPRMMMRSLPRSRI